MKVYFEMLLLIGRYALCPIKVLLEASRVRVLAASYHPAIDAPYLAKQAIAASPWLQRESGAEVMLDREVHGGGAPRLNRSSAERRQMGTGQRWGCANPLRNLSSDIAYGP
jgi:hypothetical protein